MIKKSIFWLTTIITLNTATLFAEEKPAEGSMTLAKKTWQLSQGVAYEGTDNGEEATIVMLSNQRITAQKLKQIRDAAKNGGSFPDVKQPYLRLAFKKTGELIQWNGYDSNSSVAGVTSECAKTELKIENGRAIGKITQPLDPSQMIPRGVDVKFNVQMLTANEELPASADAKKTSGPAANVKPTVTGTFMGNGKEAKLNYVSARWTEPFDNKPGILLLFTEKDHSKAKKPDNDAMFGHYGNALIISLHEDGSIYSCQVVHNGMKNKGFSSSGSIEATPFTYENGKVEGEITTNGDVDTFDEKWAVKLKFVAPLGEIPKEYQVAEEKTAAEESKASSDDADGAAIAAMANAMAKANPNAKSNAKGSQPAAAKLNAKDLALTKDASDFEYKGLVEMMSCKTKLPVKAACAELAKNLKGQGWSNDGSDLITAKSSIMKRKRGAASLTIFVKPDDAGSKIDITSEGLEWDKE